MDASHVAVAGESTEFSTNVGAAGDAFDVDDPVSLFAAAGGGISEHTVCA